MPMLKGIPTNISPELFHALLSMGHGDEIVIADGNFPAASCAQRLIRADGLGVVDILESIMKFLPVDKYVEDHCVVMQLVPSDAEKLGTPPIWKEFQRVMDKEEGNWVKLTQLERMKFYERAKQAFAVVATSDSAIYANIIIKKGVVPPK
eukprot:TRINITY_DN3053_c0_g1_i1.p1 TRINITY_DN3053_c0_g1~~TRINITY_DN3053_c0_g1_i1.p1  ORF type:complete len:150 (-),score=18.54 TRINITY_DN3053_c0_g1_i1:96-545(-)